MIHTDYLERYLLARMIIDKRKRREVYPILEGHEFFDPIHQDIYKSMREMDNANLYITPFGLCEYALQKGYMTDKMEGQISGIMESLELDLSLTAYLIRRVYKKPRRRFLRRRWIWE